MPTNTAAWIAARGAGLEVGPSPYTPPREGQIVVRNRAVAVNPLEWIIQVAGSLAYRWLDYPTVLGSDIAGDVVELGKGVTRFRVGDRVLAHAVGTDKDSNTAAQGGFQQYTVVLERMACPIPHSLAFENAAVLPLGVSTAACALFQNDHLGLQRPSADAQPTGETVLVWGGSTSVGSNAIQLAVASGYEVIATASPHNVDYVTSLGAALVFDYNSPSVVADIIEAFRSRRLAGAIAVGTTSAPSCVRIVGACTGKRFVSVASPPVSFDVLAEDTRRPFELPRLMSRLVGSNVAMHVRAVMHRTRIKYIFGTTLKSNEISNVIYRDFLPRALAEGRYVAAPSPTVVGAGVAAFQHAMDVQRTGVSATKIVVTLP